MINPNPLREYDLMMTRRQLFGRTALGLGTAAMANLLGPELAAEGAPTGPHHEPKAKRVIYLFMSGGPSHHDMWDMKPDAPASWPKHTATIVYRPTSCKPGKHLSWHYAHGACRWNDTSCYFLDHSPCYHALPRVTRLYESVEHGAHRRRGGAERRAKPRQRRGELRGAPIDFSLSARHLRTALPWALETCHFANATLSRLSSRPSMRSVCFLLL